MTVALPSEFADFVPCCGHLCPFYSKGLVLTNTAGHSVVFFFRIMAEYFDRTWHPNFKKYTEDIVKHPNYKGLYYKRSKNGNVKWVETGKSENGKKRQKWWDEQCKEHSIPIQKGCYATIARIIHPTKKKVCQCCGRTVSILYEYPSEKILKEINQHFGKAIEQVDYTIKEIIEQFCKSPNDIAFIASLFGYNELSASDTNKLQKEKLVRYIYKNFVEQCSKGYLSPGAMSNSPDRFDGFHSDGLCCRGQSDKGRHSDNMKTYSQDRRAYEEWADGDYNLANRLMGEFRKDGKKYQCPKCGKLKIMSADHIGPISLGFCHSQYNLTGLCSSCNSAKNNRFTKEDVEKLIALEKGHHKIISWHSQYIWDLLKNKVKDDNDAKKLSSIMVKCHQNVLNLFSIIYKNDGRNYLLRFLHPKYSMYDYRFEDFDALDSSKLRVIKTPRDSTNKKKYKDRYIRIAFETLASFEQKNNRKVDFVHEKIARDIDKLLCSIKTKDYKKADEQIKIVIKKMCDIISEKEW